MNKLYAIALAFLLTACASGQMADTGQTNSIYQNQYPYQSQSQNQYQNQSQYQNQYQQYQSQNQQYQTTVRVHARRRTLMPGGLRYGRRR